MPGADKRDPLHTRNAGASQTRADRGLLPAACNCRGAKAFDTAKLRFGLDLPRQRAMDFIFHATWSAAPIAGQSA
jgi:hypothetical protein